MLRKRLGFKLRVIIIALLSLIVIDLATAYVFGFVIQKTLTRQFNSISRSPFIKVISHTYHRGIFNSDETVELSLNSTTLSNIMRILPNGSNESGAAMSKLGNYSIKYTTYIEHGIFAGIINGYFMPTLAYAKTTISYPDALSKLLKTFFKGEEPLKVENVVYLNQAGKYYIGSPSFNYEEAVSGVKVKWGGLDLGIGYNNAFDKFSNKLSVPLFTLSAPTKGNIQLNNLDYTSNSMLSENKIKVGDTKLDLAALNINMKDKISISFKLGDIIYLLTGISSAEFLNNIDEINPANFSLSKVYYDSTSADSNNYFSAKANVGFAAFKTQNKSYGPFNMQISISHVLSKSFSQLIDKIGELSSANQLADNGKIKNDMIKVLKEYFGPILVNRPRIDLEQFKLVAANGSIIQLHGDATTNNFVLDDMLDQTKFMQNMEFDLYFQLPKPVVSYLFMLQMKYLLTAGNAQMDAQSSDALAKVVNILVDNQVRVWARKGYIKNTDGVLEGHLQYRNGKLMVDAAK